MRKYLSILRLGWLDALEYRTEFAISVLSWGIRLIIAVFLWVAVAEARGGSIGHYTTNTILIYFFIVQIISSFTFSRIGFDISYDIYRGDFANFLLKPLNYLLFRLIHETSRNAFRTALGLILFGTLLFVFFGGVPLPLWKIPLIILALIGAYIINFCLISMVGLLGFWITNANRLTFIYFGILTIFSGMIFPIDLFPEKWFTVFQYLPFPYIFYFPAKVIQAVSLDPTLIHGFLIQMVYVVLLTVGVSLVYRSGVRRFEAVGR